MNAPFYNGLSPFHGRGLFANRYFPVGSILFKVIDNNSDKVYELAKLVNHSYRPNIALHKEADGWYAMAIIPIYPAREILADYNCTPESLAKAEPGWW